MRQSDIDRELESFYSAGSEGARLESSSPAGVAEFLRVQTLVRAQLAVLGVSSPLRILDVGGATGIHSEWLAADGHQVTLIDPVVSQVEVARRVGTFDARVGDARSLPFDDGEFDAILLFGPLYHLYSREDRIGALREARRAVRPDGVVMSAGISRVAVVVYRMIHNVWSDDDDLLSVMKQGKPRRIDGFPAAHFHTCDELESELREAGLDRVLSEGIEGFGEGVEVLEGRDESVTEAMLVLAERLAAVPGAKDTSNHLMAWGRRPAAG